MKADNIIHVDSEKQKAFQIEGDNKIFTLPFKSICYYIFNNIEKTLTLKMNNGDTIVVNNCIEEIIILVGIDLDKRAFKEKESNNSA
jgi:hypothetical protein